MTTTDYIVSQNEDDGHRQSLSASIRPLTNTSRNMTYNFVTDEHRLSRQSQHQFQHRKRT